MKRLIALLTVLACGCSSAAADFEKICNAEALSGAAAMADTSQKAVAIAGWLKENLSSAQAREVMDSLAMVAPDVRDDVLRRAAAEAGYSGPCPMAELP